MRINKLLHTYEIKPIPSKNEEPLKEEEEPKEEKEKDPEDPLGQNVDEYV